MNPDILYQYLARDRAFRELQSQLELNLFIHFVSSSQSCPSSPCFLLRWCYLSPVVFQPGGPSRTSYLRVHLYLDQIALTPMYVTQVIYLQHFRFCTCVSWLNPVLCNQGALVLGAYSPDAVKSINPLLHSFPFAILQVQAALGLGDDGLVQFAHGYVIHLLQDYVGHHAGGFLNPKEDHPLEFACDAQLWSTRPSGFSLHRASEAVTTFFSSATAQYAKLVNNSALYVDPAAAASAWSKFGLLMDAEVVAVNFDFAFQRDILRYDVCNATTVPAALANLQLAQAWTDTAAARYALA
jgi:hypothetical protein